MCAASVKGLTIEEVGNRLKMLRTRTDLSQEELAEKCSTSQNIVSRWELGQGGSIDILLRMINFYKTSFSFDLFSDSFAENSISDGKIQTSFTSVAVEKLKLLARDLEKNLADLRKTIEFLESTSGGS